MARPRHVLAPAALVLVVAAAACGSDGSGIVEGPTTTTTEVTTVSVDEWIVAADDICADSSYELDLLEVPVSEPTVTLTSRELSEWASYLGRVVQIRERAAAAFDDLDAPSGDEAEALSEYLGRRDGRAEQERDALAAAQDADGYEFRVAYEEVLTVSADLSAAAADAGLEVCRLDVLEGAVEPGKDGPLEPGGEQPTIADWSAAASELCDEQSVALDELEDPYEEIESLDDVTEAQLPGLAEYTRSLHELTVTTVDSIAELGLPLDFEAEAEGYVADMDVVLDGLDEMATGAEEGDLDRFRAGFDLLEDVTPELEEHVAALDIQECEL